ncbi:2-C-methyl-D-erythritol 2,4-cyclodiphosphate synthase [Puia dinghuensis]|uniref:2-C-methyl-D-erythritol 2,4-cyclodiphosphate synthase n=2 Tax=Puia dinghuensis TaxID=1792502 RepID=A0A8J2XWL2_9BACT|nr:2-C-methyl-D-erythritol 2,4-cyclodiphosphate synthase [Puia dinghuensis]
MAEGRAFWLGGVQIPSTRGAVGHSDADVLIHAICDALLGALALGDIGQHFPNTDAAYKDIDSKILLVMTWEMIKVRGYRVVNIDSTVTLEAPKIMKYAPAMRETMARSLEIAVEDISIKATTTEQMGFVGRGEGIVAYAVVLLERI